MVQAMDLERKLLLKHCGIIPEYMAKGKGHFDTKEYTVEFNSDLQVSYADRRQQRNHL